MMVIGVVFVVGFVPYFRKLINAGTLTSIGILGTFVGISLALMDFDPSVDKAQESVKHMIEDMQTAFISSLVGIFAGVVYGVLNKAFYGGVFKRTLKPEDTTLHTLNTTLKDMQQSLDNHLSQMKQSMDAVKDAISGDGDGSIHTQMAKLRVTNQDGFKDLNTSFTEFAEKVSELGTKAIIQALEQVIRDFNDNLTEQFGENFKQLNMAVEKLVDWQQQYREHVETLTEKFETAQQGITTTTEQLTHIANEAEKIPPTMDSLSTLIQGANQKIDELEQRLSAFAHMKQQATDAFPIIQNTLDTMTTGLKTTIENISDDLQQTVKNVSAGFAETQDKFTETNEQFTQSLHKKADIVIANLNTTADSINTNADNMTRTISKHAQQTVDSVKTHTDELISQSEKVIKDTEGQINDALNRCVQGLEKTTIESLSTLDKNTQTLVKQQIDIMGSRLTAVVEEFINQYRRAQDTDRMFEE